MSIQSPRAADAMTVRPFSAIDDYRAMVGYFHGASDELLERMGVDRRKLPSPADWLERLWRDHQLAEDDPRRERFYLAWMRGDAMVGHSSIDQIRWGESARCHLHFWRQDLRGKGVGTEYFRLSLSAYIARFQLQTLTVEPRATNDAPNRVVRRLGFRLTHSYRGVPGAIQFEQDVNHYEITRAEWLSLREGSDHSPAS